jgi:anti-sigma factor RsiW
MDLDREAELTRLADGTLPEERRAEVEAYALEHPDALAEQRRALALLQAAADVPAPARLHAHVRAAAHARAKRRRFALPRLRLGLGGALAAAAVAVVVILVGGTAAGPTVAEAATLAARGPAAGAPAVQPGRPTLLAEKIGGVTFPAYEGKFGWRAIGRRQDRLDGRSTTTVFYAKGSRRVAYTIVDGDALDVPQDALVTTADGVRVASFTAQGRPAVTWERNGRTCVLTGADEATLVELAAWRGKGSISF